MFKDLTLTNFKSFAEPHTVPFAPVTILVGANASGKTNLIDALRFLQGIAIGITIGEVFGGKREGGIQLFPGIRGGAAEACWIGAREFEIRAGLQVAPRGSAVLHSDLIHGMKCTMDPAPRFADEYLRIPHGAVLVRRDADGHVMFKDVRPEGINLREMHVATDTDATHSMLARLDPLDPVQKITKAQAIRVRDYLAHIRVQSVAPARMTDYRPIHLDDIGLECENLSAAVYRICQDAEKKARLLEWISLVCAPKISDITFDRTQLGDVLVQFVEENGSGRTISARSLSDGTLRFLGILAALFSAPEGTTFVFEEIENGLHPTRIHLLVELFEQFAESRRLQIIATTHSSQVLLALSPEALHNVVLFARTDEAPGTITRRLGDLPHFDEVTQSSRIDELFTTGWLEFAV